MKTLLALVMLGTLACGGGSNPTSAKFQPEIVNVQDSFAFQVTGVQDGSGSFTYTWQNSGAAAKIDQAAAISAGAVTLRVKDAAGALVYTGSLTSGGSFTSSAGTAGAWSIEVDFTNASGTMNFRAQKL